jgi:FAD/FMN-containing dehydrogenase
MEIQPAELELMRNIKKIFDPKNLLNPGKIFL